MTWSTVMYWQAFFPEATGGVEPVGEVADGPPTVGAAGFAGLATARSGEPDPQPTSSSAAQNTVEQKVAYRTKRRGPPCVVEDDMPAHWPNAISIQS